MEATCITCGTKFSVPPCMFKRRQRCSMRCRSVDYMGAGNPKWRGGRTVEPTGRVRVYAPYDPNVQPGSRYVYEYRLIAAEKIGRPLRPDEIVHHVNGDHTDNRPENLEVMTQGEHLMAHNLPAISAKARLKRRVA